MAKEYIERGAWMKHISANGNPDNLPDGYVATPNDVYVFAIAAAETFPAADVVEVKHGRWMNKEVDENKWHVYGNCSVCHEKKRIDNYCPNCGAKMDGGAENA